MIRKLHVEGFVHNDLKLENILVGVKDPTQLFLIDFGLCSPYMINRTSDAPSHIKFVNLRYFAGNILFASKNSLRGFTKSRRDDIESLFYLLVFFLNGSQLPWSNLCALTNFNFENMLYHRRDP